jgi:HK97 family phage portal protein
LTIVERLTAFLRPYDMNRRTLTPAQVWGSGGSWQPLTAGISVSAEMAMQAAVGACIRLLADDISSLPVDVIRKVGGESVESSRPSWLEFPTGRRWDTFQAFLSDYVVSLLSDGNAFIEATPDTFSPRLFDVRDPEKVQIMRDGNGGVTFRSGTKTWTEMTMVHTPWIRMPGQLRGLSVLAASKESTGLELAARQWAGAFFANGGTLGTVIKHPGKPSPEELDILRESFAKRHSGSAQAFKLGILTMGSDIVNGTIRPDEAALEPLWKHVLEEAARLFHIPPHLLGSQDTGSASFASVEQRSIEYVQHAVVPVVTRIEATLSRFLGRDRYIKLNVNSLLRGDIKARADWYAIATTHKIMRPSEVRAKEDLPPDPENAGYLETPNNNAGASPTPAGDEAASIIVAPELRIDSVDVSERGVERIAAASTDGIATGIAVLGDGISERLAAHVATLAATQERIIERQDAAEERERVRSLPVSIRVSGDHVYEQRGAEVVRKRIHRDASGKVVGLVADVAA